MQNRNKRDLGITVRLLKFKQTDKSLVRNSAGVAELADAQDLGFHVSRVSNLLTDTRHYTAFIASNLFPLSTVLILAHVCSSFGYR